MCWVALDRLIALHRLIDLGIDEPRVSAERERIRTAIEEHGFNPELESYVAYFGGCEPDASLLLMARYGFAKWFHYVSIIAEKRGIRGHFRRN